MTLGLALGALAGANILVAFAYQWYVLTALGPGTATDALFAGTMVPQLVLVIVSGSLNYVLIPLLAVHANEDRVRLAWTYFQGIGAVSLALAVLLAVSAPHWVPLTVPGFSPEATRLTTQLTRIQLLGAVFTAVMGVGAAMQHARHRFLWTELAAVLASAAGLAFMVAALPRMGVRAAAWGMVIRSGLQLLLLLPGMGRYRAPDWHDPRLHVGLRRTAPLLAGQLYYKSDSLLDRFLASLAPPGTLSLYHVAQQLYASASMVLNRAIVAPVVPRLSRLADGGEWSGFGAQVRHRLRLTLGVTVLASICLALFGRPLLALAFGHGEVTPDRIAHLWLLLLLLSGVWFGGAVGQILSSAFYAQGNTRTPALVGVVGFTLAIGVKLVAFREAGIEGLAVAASLYYLLNALVLLICLRRTTRRAAGVLSVGEFARP
ncbi:MAG TPA: lipid II flippase MurJ [Gemmatimonadales bacterium]